MSLEGQLPALPQNWTWKTPAEFCSIVASGSTPKADKLHSGSGDVPFLKVYNLRFDGALDFTVKPTFISKETHEGQLARSRTRPGDVLINIVGPPLGKVSIVPDDFPEWNINQAIVTFRPSSTVTSKYLAYAFQTESVLRRVTSKAKTTAGQHNIGVEMCRKLLPVPIAPSSEQHRIVAEIEKQFTRLDAGIAALRNVQAKLKRFRAAILKAACDGTLVPTEAELARNDHRVFEAGDKLVNRVLSDRAAKWKGRGKYKPTERAKPNSAMPEGWGIASLEELSTLVTSGSRGWGEYYSDTGPQFVRAQDIKTDKLTLDTVARVSPPEQSEGFRAFAENGDILITITGANVTKSAIARGISERTYVSQHVGLVKLVCPDMAGFLFLWIICPSHGRKQLEQWAYGAGKPGLSLEQLRALPIFIPPLAEQKRIVAEVERRLSVVQELEAVVSANLQRAARLRQSILQKAFSGELVH